MTKNDIETALMISEPAFDYGGKEYSVCCPHGDLFCTWDSDENKFDFHGIDDLLEHWTVGGKPFGEIAEGILLSMRQPGFEY